MRYVLIGAGPTGLSAAARLSSLGEDWHLYEAQQQAGGLSASFSKDGYIWDLGGHVLFSHYNYFDVAMEAVMGRDMWLVHRRKAYVQLLNRWIPYPLQNNIHYLPEKEMEECINGLKAISGSDGARPGNFEEWINANSGAGLARLFMMPYNRKVWAAEPASMSASWLGERVSKPDLARILSCMNSRKDDDNWGPNNIFRFPLNGGTGAIWNAVSSQLDQSRVSYGCKVMKVDPDKKMVYFENGRVAAYDKLISTMPLDMLMGLSGFVDLQAEVEKLVYTSAHIIGVGLKGQMPEECKSKTWTYFPEEMFSFYRVTMFSNYSPNNAPCGSYSLMAEVAVRANTKQSEVDVTSRAIDGLAKAGMMSQDSEVESVWSKWIRHSYPVPTTGRDDVLRLILPALESKDIYSRGRFGAWKYEVGNMDHSFAQGREIADRLVLGIPEITINFPDAVNSSGAGNRDLSEPLSASLQNGSAQLQKNVA